MRVTTWDVKSDDEIVITCAEHGLNKTVDTPAYAANLVNYHNREAHPDEDRIDRLTILADPHCGAEPEQAYDISQAAEAFLISQQIWNTEDYRNGAMLVWQSLTGLTGAEALAKARDLASQHVITHQPPF